MILGATEEMGASAAETQEKLIRDALLLGTNVLYCDNVTLATGAVGTTPTKCSEMEASATQMSLLTPAMINKAVTILKKNRAPRINGRYYAVIHPSVAHDLRQSEGWIEAHKYAAPEELFNGEIGELHGVRFIENVFAPVLGGTDYQNKAGSKTYASYFFGHASTAATLMMWGSVMSFFNLGAWGVLYTYTPEQYPTAIRALGSGWAAGFGRFGGMAAPMMVGALLARSFGFASVFYMFALVFAAVAVIVLSLGVESKQKDLESLSDELVKAK